jgi:hypothetical protein
MNEGNCKSAGEQVANFSDSDEVDAHIRCSEVPEYDREGAENGEDCAQTLPSLMQTSTLER